jgi:hypothetical protein
MKNSSLACLLADRFSAKNEVFSMKNALSIKQVMLNGPRDETGGVGA